jgi:hypothetical protein
VIRVDLTTTGASVRLTCVALIIPTRRGGERQREYERRPFSRLAEWAGDGQCRYAAEAAVQNVGVSLAV